MPAGTQPASQEPWSEQKYSQELKPMMLTTACGPIPMETQDLANLLMTARKPELPGSLVVVLLVRVVHTVLAHDGVRFRPQFGVPGELLRDESGTNTEYSRQRGRFGVIVGRGIANDFHNIVNVGSAVSVFQVVHRKRRRKQAQRKIKVSFRR